MIWELQMIYEDASKEAMILNKIKNLIKRDPKQVIKFAHLITQDEYDSYIKQIPKLPKKVFYAGYMGDTEIIRNPSDSDRRKMTSEVRSEFGRDVSGDPETRFTNDIYGNTWIWKSHQGLHAYIEPMIENKENVEVNQNNRIPNRSEIVRQAIKNGEFIPDFVKKEFSRYEEFFKPESSNIQNIKY
jgi:hypothetical protein